MADDAAVRVVRAIQQAIADAIKEAQDEEEKLRLEEGEILAQMHPIWSHGYTDSDYQEKWNKHKELEGKYLAKEAEAAAKRKKIEDLNAAQKIAEAITKSLGI